MGKSREHDEGSLASEAVEPSQMTSIERIGVSLLKEKEVSGFGCIIVRDPL